MTALVSDRMEVRALLSHSALCFTLAGGLGFIAAGLAGLDLQAFVALSRIAQDVLAIGCIAASFAILWCSPEGPDLWRPFIVSRELGERVFGAAATIIVIGGIAAVIAFDLG